MKSPAKSSKKPLVSTKTTTPATTSSTQETRHKQAGQTALFLLRISLGILFFSSGLVKVLNPEWTSATFLTGAKTFNSFYQWFGSISNISWVNFLNEWGQLLIGLGLIFGCFTRWACFFGAVMMILYYFPGLDFPYVGPGHSFIVDEHLVYFFAFGVLSNFKSGEIWGLDKLFQSKR